MFSENKLLALLNLLNPDSKYDKSLDVESSNTGPRRIPETFFQLGS